jgi:hypothetical protein
MLQPHWENFKEHIFKKYSIFKRKNHQRDQGRVKKTLGPLEILQLAGFHPALMKVQFI